MGNPQSLNLYTYVGNNPINGVDADGHDPASQNGGAQCGSSVGEQGLAAGNAPGQVACSSPAPAAAQQQNQHPAPTDPQGKPLPPPTVDNQGNRILPPGTEWEHNKDSGTPKRPDGNWKPDPKLNPSVDGKGGQPKAQWDPDNGHWDVDQGNGTRDRYLPDGTKVDHHNNPIPRQSTPLDNLKDGINNLLDGLRNFRPTPLPVTPIVPILAPI
jgi:hypothetical protein